MRGEKRVRRLEARLAARLTVAAVLLMWGFAIIDDGMPFKWLLGWL